MSEEKQFALSEDNLIERLRTNDTDVIDTIYEGCLKMLANEEDRKKSLDAKGSEEETEETEGTFLTALTNLENRQNTTLHMLV